jgi:hypothetical protein
MSRTVEKHIFGAFRPGEADENMIWRRNDLLTRNKFSVNSRLPRVFMLPRDGEIKYLNPSQGSSSPLEI